jgi:NADH:ubiquinone oxidoreductase subunit 4 (subunit M)
MPDTSLGNLFHLSFCFGIDGISLWLVLLHFSNTHLYTCGLARTSNSRDQSANLFKMYCLIWLILETILIIVFTVRDLLVFFFFFEAVLIPMFLLVGLFGLDHGYSSRV